MLILFQIILFTFFIYVTTTCLGIGIIGFVFKGKCFNKADLFVAPWLGFLTIGIISLWFSFFGFGTEIATIFIVALGLSFWFYFKKILNYPALLLIGSLIVLGTLSFSIPLILNADRLTTITAGNHDAYPYALTAEVLKKEGILPYIKAYQSPHPIPINYTKEVTSQLLTQIGFNPRLMSVYNLSFFSILFNIESSELFSLFNTVTFVMILPLLYYFIYETLQLKGWVQWSAFLFCLMNPHILYILYHDFLPQIMGTGFLILFISYLPQILENKSVHWTRSSLSLALLTVGVLLSYLDFIPALALISFLTLIFKCYKKEMEGRVATKIVISSIVLIILLAPYHGFQFFSYLWDAQLSGGAKYGWDVTKRYYLFLLPLGSYFTHPAPQPTLFLEWILAPLLFYLIYLGIKKSARGTYFLFIIIPFILSGTLSFLKDYNYAYFKNFTYIYYWLPIAVIQGLGFLCKIMKNKGLKQIVFTRITFTIIFLIFLQATIKAGERMSYVSRNCNVITTSLSSLKKIEDKTEMNPIIIDETLSFWETLWALYYLKDTPRSYESFEFDHNPDGKNRFKYLLKKKNITALTNTLENTHTKVIYENKDYALLEYPELQPLYQPQIRLEDGFSPRENNALEQWVWLKGEAKLLLRSNRDIEKLTFTIDAIEPAHLNISINNQMATSLILEKGLRKNYTVCFPVPLTRGTHEIKLNARDYQTQNKKLNIRIYKIV